MKANNITIETVEVNNVTEYIYLIDGIYYQQKSKRTTTEAKDAAVIKIEELKRSKRK